MLNKPKIRVLVVDDSLVFDRFLIENLPKAQSRIEVVGYAMNAYDAMRKIPSLKPDVITLDVEMPKMSGIEFLKELLPKHPIPVILVSSLNVSVFDALSYGAVDFVRKPDMSTENSTSRFVQNLSAKILIASQAKVKLPARKSPASASHASAARSDSTKSGSAPQRRTPACSSSIIKLTSASALRLNSTVIAIGASTGGTEATLEVLRQLPEDIPGIVITQHMPKGFTQMYAERLNRLCRMQVKEAEDGDIIRRGRALIAPGGDLQMKVVRSGRDYVVRCLPGEKVNGHRPSVDVLFQSVAQTVKSSSVGIILTGMGQDGAQGLLQMKKSGAYTIGQDKDSCVVYGMPMVAQEIGAVTKQASCSVIPKVLMAHLNSF